MKRITRVALIALIWIGLIGFWGLAQKTPVLAAGHCEALSVDVDGDTPLQAVTLLPEKTCTIRMSNGYPIPDPSCTPGAINPTLTLDVLRNPDFRTSCLRDKAAGAAKKRTTYDWYSVAHPAHNTGASQTCELDHLVSLELGGADTLDNIWPQCGPPGVELNDRYFKQKDLVENYPAKEVREGRMDLNDAQKGIATDWTQYLKDADNAVSP